MFLEQIASRRLELALTGNSPKRAKIENCKTGDEIRVSFNPESITYKACPRYAQLPNAGAKKSGNRMTYGGNFSSELSMKLLLDTTRTGKSVYDKYVKFLIGLTVPDEEKGFTQPPKCKFKWGEFTEDTRMGFEAVLSGLQVEYIWFLPDGTPVRATTDLTFKEYYEADELQNPTSRSEARKVWRVIEGQTLDWIAYQEYGDSAAWRHIARVNNLQNPRDLRPGMVLRLLPLP